MVADDLGIDVDAAFGKLVRFWIWCDIQSISGNALGVTKTFLDRLVHQPGFSDALIKAGWLQVRSGSLEVPHFDRHNGQTAKARAVTNRRVSKHRVKCNAVSNVNSVTRALQKPLPEEEEEEDKLATLALRGRATLPESLGTPAMQQLWPDWLQHWSETFARGKPMPEQTAHAQLRALVAIGPERACAAINNAIARGLREPAEPLAGSNGKAAKPQREPKLTIV